MITTKIYYWHDGVIKETTHTNNVGFSHLVVTIRDGIPVSSTIVLG